MNEECQVASLEHRLLEIKKWILKIYYNTYSYSITNTNSCYSNV